MVASLEKQMLHSSAEISKMLRLPQPTMWRLIALKKWEQSSFREELSWKEAYAVAG
jgi:hypothetical protein